MKRRTLIASTGIGLLLAAGLLAGCQEKMTAPQAGQVTAERLLNADAEPGSWLNYGRDYAEQRFSPLDQINVETIKDLGLTWYHDFDTARGQEATPLVVDGTLYTTTSWSKVYAFDAVTGALKWSYDPQVPGETGHKGCCDVVNRGVAVWQGKVFVGTFDGRLVALDAASGKPVWSVVTVDQSKPYTITGAPRVINGKVLIGNGGAEFGVRGYISAYDAETGKQIWRWYSVPGDPSKPFEQPELENAAKTWSGQWWKFGGGGTMWDAMAYDPKLDLLYVGVGNGSPWNHMKRSDGKGDNLFLSSIVALRPETGEYVWHYQTTPGESWDFTATQHIILADINIDGQPRKVLMQAPKNGFFYVLDRETGKLISARNFVPISWATGVDLKTGRPIEVPEARFAKAPALVAPSAIGAHNWQPMAFNPKTGLVYLPAQEAPGLYADDSGFQLRPGAWNTALDTHAMLSLPDEKAQRAAIKAALKGQLIAWDPVAQKEVWRASHNSFWNGGVLTTAGNLVLQGNSDGQLVAYRADNGEKLWNFALQTGVTAPPMTYSIDGVQYVALMVGWGGAGALALPNAAPTDMSGRLPIKGRLMVFKLGGTAKLPPLEANEMVLPDVQNIKVDAGKVAAGAKVYAANCAVCHGPSAVGNGVTPDLRYSGALDDTEAWRSIVIDGALKDNGMVSFANWLKPEDAEAIRHYVADQSQRFVASAANGK